MKKVLLSITLLLLAAAGKAQDIKLGVSNTSCFPKTFQIFADYPGSCGGQFVAVVQLNPGTVVAYSAVSGPFPTLPWATSAPTSAVEFNSLRVFDMPAYPAIGPGVGLASPACTGVWGYPSAQPVSWPCNSLVLGNWSNPAAVYVVAQ